MLGALLFSAAGLLPHAGDRLSRRSALLSGAAALTVAASPAVPARAVELPTYDEEGRVVNTAGYSEDTGFRLVSDKGDPAASARLLGNWKWEPSGELIDPVQGSTATVLQFTARDVPLSKKGVPLSSITDLGKPENLQVQRAFGLEAELERADMVAAAKRTVDGVVFYEYDLALSPLKCDREMATACLPNKVILLSSSVRDGKLHLLRVDADAVQWKRAGAALRLLRSSFAVVEAAA